jgi:DhnA family fructose-bisphosphate aldolase class Ia
MVEPIPVSFANTEAHTPERIGQAARIACEVGGDVIKMQYTGDPESFREAIAPLYRPVVILGGPERGDDYGLLQGIREAIDAGAIGIAIGRNIWNRDAPGRMVAAFNAIIHADASAEVAARELRTSVAVGV